MLIGGQVEQGAVMLVSVAVIGDNNVGLHILTIMRLRAIAVDAMQLLSFLLFETDVGH